MSYGSAVTVMVDLAVVGIRYVRELAPASEWEWLIFVPAVVAGGVCWVVVGGLVWGAVVV